MLHHKPGKKDEMLNIYLDVTLLRCNPSHQPPNRVLFTGTVYHTTALAMTGSDTVSNLANIVFRAEPLESKLSESKNLFD